MSDQTDYAGMAAFSICEALILALKDRKILPDHEIEGVLRDAEAALKNAVGTAAEKEVLEAVGRLISTNITGGNSVRRL